jgi:exosortase/archaeosortase family protein
MTLMEGVLVPGRVISGVRERGSRSSASVSDWWLSLTSSEQARIKVAVLVSLVGVAFHYSLSSLLATISYDTPLAYVGLVPLLAAGLAWLHRVPAANEPPIHDRQLDYIFAIPLMGASLLAAFILPGRMGLMYWFDRIDLLLLPIFVAGAVVMLFGTRVAWRQRFAIAYLFLAWPWPYSHILLGTLNGFTNLTVGALDKVLEIIKVAHPVASSPGLFEVVHRGQTFPVSVVTACSGIDGMVGFLLVGIAFAGTVSGSWIRKAIWLACGLVLLWSTNLGRLLLIFWAGKDFGESFAINVLHPVAGLVIFCIGVISMALLVRPFGLQLFDGRTAAALSTKPVATKSGAPRVFLAAGLVAVMAFVLCVNNTKLSSYELVSTAAGEPKLASFLADPAEPAGWTATWDVEETINKPLFGESSRWFRYTYEKTGPSNLASTLPVTADVINAGGLAGFSEYGVEDCYSFHGYLLRDVAQVNLGDGVTGQTMSYSGSGVGENWSIVYWIWPVETGTGTRYERVILYLQNTPGEMVKVLGQVPGVNGLANALNASNPADAVLIQNRAFLVAFARQVVAGQTLKTDKDVDIADIVGGTPSTTHSPAYSGSSRKLRLVRHPRAIIVALGAKAVTTAGR